MMSLIFVPSGLVFLYGGLVYVLSLESGPRVPNSIGMDGSGLPPLLSHCEQPFPLPVPEGRPAAKPAEHPDWFAATYGSSDSARTGPHPRGDPQ